MNICIMTVYNSINPGSFWQAYSLGTIMEKMGHKVYFYQCPSKGSPSDPLIQKKIFLKTFIKCGISEAKRYKESIKEYKSIQQEKFIIIDENSSVFSEIDYFVVGSDTVWNFNDSYFSRWFDFFGGLKFPPDRLLSYAASTGNSSFGVKDKKEKAAFLNYKSMSVRDAHTKNEIYNISGRDSTLVCDPTLLLGKDDDVYNLDDRLHIEKPYIFIYLFEPLTKKQEKELLAYAKKFKYRIVSTLRKENAPYTDEVVVNTPINFCECMRNADIVITDTYHGTIFPLIFRKQFVTLNRDKVTVNSIMSQLGLEKRLGNESNFKEILNSEIDYQKVDKKIEVLRSESYKFLEDHIREKNEKI